MAGKLRRLWEPSRRPRTIIWSGVTILGLAAFVIVAIVATSTRMFCSEVCHSCQDDTIASYERSVHANISCLACHMPVGANPAVFIYHKAEAGIVGGYQVVSSTFTLPLNPESAVALETPQGQCTQCHSMNRKVTPRAGLIIDHKAHADKGVACTVCHNRVAHPEDQPLILAGNTKHADFLTMDGCFRCHGLEAGAEAPGRCGVCHPSDFDLKPPSHDAAGFYTKGGDSSGHAKLARDERKKVTIAEQAELASEKTAEKETAEGEIEIPNIEEVDTCFTCHVEKDFCDACHKLPMPHPSGFEKSHRDAGTKSPQVCSNCHATGKAAGTADTSFCSDCHHKDATPGTPWIKQHFSVAKTKGATGCFKCHDPLYCEECHVRKVSKLR